MGAFNRGGIMKRSATPHEIAYAIAYADSDIQAEVLMSLALETDQSVWDIQSMSIATYLKEKYGVDGFQHQHLIYILETLIKHLKG